MSKHNCETQLPPYLLRAWARPTCGAEAVRMDGLIHDSTTPAFGHPFLKKGNYTGPVSGHPLGSLLPFSSSPGIIKASFASALATSSNLKEGEFITSVRPCYVAACVGKADGLGERACAAALTVGLIFW